LAGSLLAESGGPVTAGNGSSFAEDLAGYGARESLARQISQKLIYSARRGLHRLKMDLDPESLGHLDVELKVKGDKLTANIKAESLEAYEALEKDVSALKESLGLAGLKLSLSLSYDGPTVANNHGEREQGGKNGRSGNGIGQSQDAESEGPEGRSGESLMAQSRLLDRVV
jgi:flagellar hook-length control protein FliK